MKTIAKITKTFISELKNIYPDTEIKAFLNILFEHYAGMNKTQTFLHPDKELDEASVKKFTQALEKLKKEIPLQYITGVSDFYGLQFKVSPDVLIPRPETEELVDLIIQNHRQDKQLNILDIGTGSGCIPIALKKNLASAKISAMDISKAALQIAGENAQKNQCTIHFFKDDILHPQLDYEYFDIIVSNPPYVRELEKKMMQKNVLENEPHQALFVPDNDALIFYRAIIDFAGKYLKKTGFLYLEINEFLSTELSNLLYSNSFINIKTHKDLQGKYRMISAVKP